MGVKLVDLIELLLEMSVKAIYVCRFRVEIHPLLEIIIRGRIRDLSSFHDVRVVSHLIVFEFFWYKLGLNAVELLSLWLTEATVLVE